MRTSGVRIPAEDYSMRTGRRKMAYMEVGPYLTVRPGHRALHVLPTDLTLETVRKGTIAIPYDTISFEVIVWDPKDALVVASHSQIIGSMWLSVIDPLTIPGWAPSRRAAEALAYARRKAGPDAYLVAADAFEEGGAEETAEWIRAYAKTRRRSRSSSLAKGSGRRSGANRSS